MANRYSLSENGIEKGYKVYLFWIATSPLLPWWRSLNEAIYRNCMLLTYYILTSSAQPCCCLIDSETNLSICTWVRWKVRHVLLIETVSTFLDRKYSGDTTYTEYSKLVHRKGQIFKSLWQLRFSMIYKKYFQNQEWR